MAKTAGRGDEGKGKPAAKKAPRGGKGATAPFTTEILAQVTGEPLTIPLATEDGMGTLPAWQAVTHNRTADAVVSDLTRFNPIPALHHVFAELLAFAYKPYHDPKDPPTGSQESRLLYVQSHPGMGKTDLPVIVSKALGYKTVFFGSGSGGGDLDQLVVMDTFNGKSAGDVIDRINQKLTSYPPEDLEDPNNTSLLLQGLRKITGANGEPDGLLDPTNGCINVSALGLMDRDKDGAARKIGPTERKREDEEFRARMKQVYELYQQVEIGKGGSTINIEQTNGPLLDALIKARDEAVRAKRQSERTGKPVLPQPVIVVLDEFNRYHHFGSRLQDFWALLGGTKLSDHPVFIDGFKDGKPYKYEFTYDDLRSVMFVLTGNDPEREPEARALPDAMKSRIKMFSTREPDAADWQHALERRTAGVPLNTMLQAGAGYYDQGEDRVRAFGELLKRRLHGGLSEEARRAIPPDFEKRLDHWQDVHSACTKLGAFLQGWAEVHYGSKYGTERRNIVNRAPQIDLRLINKLVADAYTLPKGGAKAADVAAAQASGRFEPPTTNYQNFGTRLIAEIHKQINETYSADQAPQMRRALHGLMLDHNLISIDEYRKLDNGAYKSEQRDTPVDKPKLVADLLNCITRKRNEDVLRPMQELMLKVLGEKYPGQYGPNALTLDQVDAALEAIEAREKELLAAGKGSKIPDSVRQVLAVDLNAQGGRIETALKPMTVVDSITLKDAKAMAETPGLAHAKAAVEGGNQHISFNQLMMGLAVAQDISAQVNALRNPDAANIAAPNEALAQTPSYRIGKNILAGTDASKLSYSQVEVSAPDNKAAPREFLQVFNVYTPDDKDPKEIKNITLIVGQSALDPAVKKLLEEKRITYVSTQDADAKDVANKKLAEIVGRARQNIAPKDTPFPDQLKVEDYAEGQSKGLLYGLVYAMTKRSTDAGQLTRSTPSTQANLETGRIHNIAERICSPEYHRVADRTPIRTSQHVIAQSWAEIASASGATTEPGRA